MNDMFSIFVIQSLLWIVLLFFIYRLIKFNSKLKEEIDQVMDKADIANKGE